ncbi:uncharacterized protein [Triticum aestivum]|uniref:uncharacterized protein n=1 Tax=Triticum aestivum TaxID=4565 RepID=UPI001D02E043|nr:uncharacterized protein LOC123082220 [Triticum aestivum]
MLSSSVCQFIGGNRKSGPHLPPRLPPPGRRAPSTLRPLRASLPWPPHASHLPAAARLLSPAAAHCRWRRASFHRSMDWCSPRRRYGHSGATASPPSRAYRLASSLAPSAPRRTTSSTDHSPPLPRAVHHCHPRPFIPAPDFPSIPQGTSNDNEQATSVLMSSGTVAWIMLISLKSLMNPARTKACR